MRKTSMLLFASIALLSVACSDGSSEEQNEVEAVSYTADTETSTINWRGGENDQHFHVGTVNLKDGMITMKGDELVDGNFTVDMSTITSSTEGYPAEKLAYLNNHLKDTAFFFVSDFPEVTVKLNSYKEGTLNATFNILGNELTQDVPVAISSDEKGASIKGKFNLDITNSKLPYLSTVNEETGKPALQPELEFDIDIQLKK